MRAGVSAKRAAGRGWRIRPADGWSLSSRISFSTICGWVSTCSRLRIGAHGTPSRSSRSSHSALLRSRSAAAVSSSRAATFTMRPVGVAKRGIVEPLGVLERAAHPAPLRVRHGTCRDVAVLRREHEVLRDLRAARLHLAAHERVARHPLGPEVRDHHVEHGELHVLAAPAALAREQRRGDRLRRGYGGGLVRDDRAHHARPPVRLGLDRGQSGERLDHRVVHALVCVGPGLAEAADRDVDDVRTELPHGVLAQAHALDRAGTEVLDEHVAARDQPPQRVETGRRLEVDRERALAAVRGEERRARARAVRAQVAHEVALERLHLDHVRALIREHHRRDRTRDHAGQVEDADAFERAGRGRGHGVSLHGESR